VGRGKVAQSDTKTFEANFNILLYISIGLKLLQILNKFDGNPIVSATLPVKPADPRVK